MLNPFPIRHLPFPCSFKIKISMIFGIISLVLGVILLWISCEKLTIHRDELIECDDNGKGSEDSDCFDARMFLIVGIIGILAALFLIASFGSICYQNLVSWMIFHLFVIFLAAAGFIIALHMHLDEKTKQPEWVSLITIFGLACAWSIFACLTFLVFDLLYPNLGLFVPFSKRNSFPNNKQQVTSKDNQTQAFSKLGSSQIQRQKGQSLTPNEKQVLSESGLLDENRHNSILTDKSGFPQSTPNGNLANQNSDQLKPISSQSRKRVGQSRSKVQFSKSQSRKPFRWTSRIIASIIFGIISFLIGAFLLIISCYTLVDYRERQAESDLQDKPSGENTSESDEQSFEDVMIMIVAILGIIAALFLFASFGCVCYQDFVWWFYFHMIVFLLTLAAIIILFCFTITDESSTDEWNWLFVALILACIWSLLASILIPIDSKSKQKVFSKVRDFSKSLIFSKSSKSFIPIPEEKDENLGNSISREEKLVIPEPEPVPIVEPEIPKPAPMFGRSIPRPAPIIEPEIPEPVPIVEAKIPEPVPIVEPEIPEPVPIVEPETDIPKPTRKKKLSIPKSIPIPIADSVKTIPKPASSPKQSLIPRPVRVKKLKPVPKPSPMTYKERPSPKKNQVGPSASQNEDSDGSTRRTGIRKPEKPKNMQWWKN